LSKGRRKRLEAIHAAMLGYVDHAAAAVADVEAASKRGGLISVDRNVYYALLAATTAALDADDRRRELRVTLFVASVAMLATAVQAGVGLLEFFRRCS
jgi:hypothetical protein